jgi:hypothetical protein
MGLRPFSATQPVLAVSDPENHPMSGGHSNE